MARVTRIVEQPLSNPKAHPTEVECVVGAFGPIDARTIQISTYGSSDRKGTGVSQTLQFDAETAEQLVDYLRRMLDLE